LNIIIPCNDKNHADTSEKQNDEEDEASLNPFHNPILSVIIGVQHDVALLLVLILCLLQFYFLIKIIVFNINIISLYIKVRIV